MIDQMNTKGARRDEKRRKKLGSMRQSGKSLSDIYANAVRKRLPDDSAIDDSGLEIDWEQVGRNLDE